MVGTLTQAGAGAIAVAARTPGRAQVLLDSLAVACGRVVPWTEAEMRAALARAELVVSCLPPEAQPPGLGVPPPGLEAPPPGLEAQPPGLEAPPPGPEALSPRAVVLDVVYGRDTALLAAARQVGARAAGGLEMLVQQGALAFELWTRQAAPVDTMRTAARAELRAQVARAAAQTVSEP